MNIRAWAGVLVACCVLSPRPAAAADDVTMFRVFLTDGSTLVSYGEPARVGDRLVFSMPTSASAANPSLQLVNIPASKVDWARTNRYAESARASHYIGTAAEADYASLSNQVATALNEIDKAGDASKRLAIVEQARRTLADWPRDHFYYRANEVRQMVAMLDEAIANLRAAGGSDRFDLSLVAYADPPVYETLMPPLTPREAIEQTLSAARLSESAADRETLLGAVVDDLDRDAAALPADWAAETRASTAAAIEEEQRTDREYQTLAARIVVAADRRARNADVRGVERVVAIARRGDMALGGKRPEAFEALLAAVEAKLDAARQLRLARDHWALRLPELRRYQLAMETPLDLLADTQAALESIKTLAGPAPASLVDVQHAAARIRALAARVAPPEELRSAHALLESAAGLAENAARIRREAVASGNMARAWDASSAAAGALMLAARAQGEIQSALRPPQLH